MANVNADIVQIDADEEFSISISDKERPDFYFTVGQPSLTTDLRTFFKFSFFPLSESIYSLAEYNNEKSHVISNLAHWLNIIAEYNSINLSPEDELTIYYSDEFYDEFELVEDDASTKPFDHARQLLLYNLLLTLETALVKHSNEENISEIIAQSEELRGNIQNLSRTATTRKMARIFAMVKKSGIKLFKEVAAEAKKEIIKAIIKGASEQISGYIGAHL